MKQKHKKRVLIPDVISGGKAIALGSNYYYMDGKKHEAGGIKVGKNAKTGLEVEGGEVMHLTKDSAKVFSAVPFLNGESPANKVMKGENPKKVFDKQEDFKDRNKLNDDGSTYRNGGRTLLSNPSSKGSAHKRKIGKRKRAQREIDVANKANPSGGRFGGGGAGRQFTTYKNKVVDSIYVRPVVLEDRTFNDAFKKARNSGKTSFKFNNKDYNTDLGNNPDNVKAGNRRRESVVVPLDTVYLHDVKNRYSDDDIKSKRDTINLPLPMATKYDKGVKKKRLGGDEVIITGKAPKKRLAQINSKLTNDFKDRNKLNDDGTSKNRSSAKLGLGKRIANYGKTKNIKDDGSIKLDEVKLLDVPNLINASDVKISSNIKTTPTNSKTTPTNSKTTPTRIKTTPTRIKTTPTNIKENKLEKRIKALSKFLDTNDINSSDLIGLSGNVAGSLISYASNKNTLKKMKAPKQPVAKRSTKLKTKINIQPQLDKMREDVASYTRDVNSNTSSSRTSLARTNRARLASQMNTNELYGAKENAETQLINQDRLNQQQVGNENIEAYNRWNDSVTEHNNKILDAKGENTIGMITGLNSSVQDLLSRREKRRQFNENVKIISAANPNVSDELLESLGVTTVKNARKSNASNNKKGK